MTTSAPKKTTKSKATTAKMAKTTAKATPAAAAATSAPAQAVDAPKPVVLGPMMRKPELVDAVVAKSGMKKKDVKPIVEATLAVLGSALQDARELNLEPMGKVKVTRAKDRTKGKLLVARIRQTQELPSLVANPNPKDLNDDAVLPTAVE